MMTCSIVIPTHNRPDLLPRAVRSALLACPSDGEVIVLDDRSAMPAQSVLAGVSDRRLRVVRNTGSGGASRARNLGVSVAMNEVVFFLDDDDEIVKDYCQRILQQAGPATQAQWGFSATLIRSGELSDSDQPFLRRRLRRGIVPARARVRDQIAAMSEGFWIRKKTFEGCGGLDSELSIDEDTDLCIRLKGVGILPWYEADPGMVVYRGYQLSASSAAQLTASTSVDTGLACYRRTFSKNEGSFSHWGATRWFLISRFLRRAVKQGRTKLAWEFVSLLQPRLLRLFAAVFVLLKMAVHANRVAKARG